MHVGSFDHIYNTYKYIYQYNYNTIGCTIITKPKSMKKTLIAILEGQNTEVTCQI